jgi:hypothetical protein
LSCNLGTLTSWNPLGHSRPVTGLLYLYYYDDDDDDDDDDNNNVTLFSRRRIQTT